MFTFFLFFSSHIWLCITLEFKGKFNADRRLGIETFDLRKEIEVYQLLHHLGK